MKYYSLLLPLLVLYGCSKDYLLQRNIDIVSRELKEMKEAEQGVRHIHFLKYYYGVNDQQLRFIRTIDSLRWINKESESSKVLNISNKSMVTLKPVKELLDSVRYKEYSHYKEELNSAMSIIDDQNTKRLLQITKKYGFPSHERLVSVLGDVEDKSLTSSPQLIFVHAEKEYFPQIIKLLKKEYKAGRIDKNACGHIMWHLNGREGNLFEDIENFCSF